MNRKRLFRGASAWLGLSVAVLANATATETDLAPWSIFGADKAKLAEAGTLILPAGAQLGRVVAGASFLLRMESSPVFGRTAVELPLIELGDAALAFIGDETTGRLVLVLGGNPAIKLPYEIALDEIGRSAEPLDIIMSRDGATVALTMRGQTMQFPAGYGEQPHEVVVSAGTAHGWEIQSLALAVRSAQGAAYAYAGHVNLRHDREDNVRQQAVSGNGRSGEDSRAEAASDVAGPIPEGAVAPDGSRAGPTLELFTPPAVRSRRAALVRETVIESLQK